VRADRGEASKGRQKRCEQGQTEVTRAKADRGEESKGRHRRGEQRQNELDREASNSRQSIGE
jgi:hypothetical protein